MLAKHGWIWQSLSCYSALLALLTLFTRVGRVWVLPISAGQTFHSETTKFGSVWYYLKQYGVYAPWAHNSCQASLPFPTIMMPRPVEKMRMIRYKIVLTIKYHSLLTLQSPSMSRQLRLHSQTCDFSCRPHQLTNLATWSPCCYDMIVNLKMPA